MSEAPDVSKSIETLQTKIAELSQKMDTNFATLESRQDLTYRKLTQEVMRELADIKQMISNNPELSETLQKILNPLGPP